MNIELTTYEAIKDFLKEEWASFFNLKQIKRGQSSKSYFFKVEEEGQLIGAAILSIKDSVGTLEDIIIKKIYRDKDIGKRLLDSIEKTAKKENCRKILVKTSEIHRGAKGFYESNNYIQIAKLPNMWYGSDWYFFVKDL